MSTVTIIDKKSGAMTSFEAEVNIPEKIADEPRDFSQPGEWEPQSFHATGTCILSDESPISKMLKQWKKREHQNIKQLLWAVTHGYTVQFKFIVKDKHGRMHQEFYQVDRPRKLKALLRAIHVIPQYIIVDRKGDAFSLRHGKWHYYGSILYRPNPNWESKLNPEVAKTAKKLIVTQLYQDPIKTNSEPPMINIAEVEHTPLTVDDLKPGDVIHSHDGMTATIRKVTAAGVYVYIDGLRDVIMESQLHHWFL